LLREINAQLPIPFDLSTGALRQIPGVRLVDQPTDMGVLQILRRPNSDNSFALVVAGTTQRGYELALRAATQPELYERLEGQVAIITAEASSDSLLIESFHIPTAAAVPIIGQTDALLRDLLGVHSPWPHIVIVGGVALLLAGIIAFGRHAVRRRSRIGRHRN
jgi:hypothetical protein